MKNLIAATLTTMFSVSVLANTPSELETDIFVSARDHAGKYVCHVPKENAFSFELITLPHEIKVYLKGKQRNEIVFNPNRYTRDRFGNLVVNELESENETLRFNLNDNSFAVLDRISRQTKYSKCMLQREPVFDEYAGKYQCKLNGNNVIAVLQSNKKTSYATLHINNNSYDFKLIYNQTRVIAQTNLAAFTMLMKEGKKLEIHIFERPNSTVFCSKLQ